MQVEIFEYVMESRKKPYGIWLENLRDIQALARIETRIDRLKRGIYGNCEPVGGGVSELKIDYGPGYRIYFGKDGAAVVILLCGGDKSSQREDIRTAQAYWQDYRRRK